MRAFLEPRGLFASIDFSGRVDNSFLADHLVKLERKWKDFYSFFLAENEVSAKQIHGQICGQMPFSSEYVAWTVAPKSLLLSTVLMFLPQNRSICNLITSLLENCFQYFCGLNWQPLAWRLLKPPQSSHTKTKIWLQVVLWGDAVVLLSDREDINFMLLFDRFFQT